MSVDFKETEREYYVLTNYPELVKRAEELGYEGVSLFTGSELDESDIDHIKQADKSVVKILFRPEKREEYGGMSRGWLEDSELYNVTIDLAGNEIEEGKHIETLEDAIEHFPNREDLEKRLRSAAIINEIDYTNRCGNCHSYLGEDDKYCRYCGTERGQGKFLPYKNVIDCVYGPPVKKKYKCTACGHIWITGDLGGDQSKYCPQCGKKTLNVLEDKALWDFFTSAIGYEEPYDTGEEPVLLQEDEVIKLLEQRETLLKEEDGSEMTYIDRETVLSALRNAGIDIPEDADYHNYPRTEKEGEQINLALVILQLKGSNPKGCKKIYCHHCGSDYVAALGYTVRGKSYEKIAQGVHAPTGKDALVYNGHGVIDYDNPESKNRDHLAYICLRCGAEFGKLELPKNLEILYKKQLAKKEAEKIGKGAAEVGKNAVYAAVGVGVLAGDAAKKAAGKVGDMAKAKPQKQDIADTVKKAGKGVQSAAKSVKKTLDKTKDKIASKSVYCFQIVTADSEDTETIMNAVSLIKKTGYDARIYVAGGTMFGYVFAKGEDHDKIAELLASEERAALSDQPVDKFMAELIKKHKVNPFVKTNFF